MNHTKQPVFYFQADFVWSDDWADFEDYSYKFFSDVFATARVAADACRGEGGLLVSINSAEEMEFVALSVLRKRTLSAFIGGTDSAEGIKS